MLQMYDFSGFSRRLREVIEENNLTQVEVAKQLGISKHNFTNYLHGRVPETTILFALSRYFNRSMEWFLVGDCTEDSISVRSASEESSNCELQKMINVLTQLMKSSDPDLKGWAKVQFKLAFGDILDEKTGKAPYPYK